MLGSGTDTTADSVPPLILKENNSPITTTSRPLTEKTLEEPDRPVITPTLSAPLLQTAHSSPVKSSTVPTLSLNCLAVDDNPINLRLLRMFIDKLGHRHVLAKTGVEAVGAYTKAVRANTPFPAPIPSSLSAPTSTASVKTDPNGFDVILMDINMPEMDGLQATRQIRAHERDNGLSPVTIIALTGVASSETQQEAHASGVNLFLIKPLRYKELEVVLKGVVTGKQGKEKEKSEGSGAQDRRGLGVNESMAKDASA